MEACAGHDASLTRLPAELPEPLRRLRLAALLGYGAFAQVVEVRDEEERGYALKVVEKGPLAVRGMLPQLALEFGVQRAIRHEHVVGALELAEDATHAYLLLELCSGGSAWEAARRFPGGRVPEAAGACWLRDAAAGIAHLHELGLVHRDIKLENLLLDGAGRVRICDLGWCAFEADEPRGRCGTPQLAPPEVLLGEPHTSKMDMWALGACLVQLLSGITISGPEDACLPSHASAEAHDLAAGLLCPDPRRRIDARSALGRPLLRATRAGGLSAAPTGPAAEADVAWRNSAARAACARREIQARADEARQAAQEARELAAEALRKVEACRVALSAVTSATPCRQCRH